MKTIKLILLNTFACLLCASSCKKTEIDEVAKLPPATQIGANTFGCLYNGSVFTPAKSGAFNTIPEGDPIKILGYDFDSRKIDAVRRDGKGSVHYIWLYMHNAKRTGGYELDNAIYHNTSMQPTHSYIVCRAVSPTTGQYKLYGSYENSGEIVVTYRNDSGIFSGTFQATLREENGTETVQITDGRFDINPKTLE